MFRWLFLVSLCGVVAACSASPTGGGGNVSDTSATTGSGGDTGSNPPQSDATTPLDTGDPAPADTGVPSRIGPDLYGFMAVHLDPGSPAVVNDKPAIERAAQYFPTLASLVDAADGAGHVLTLMFTPQWALFVASPVCSVPDDGDNTPTYRYQGEDVDSCLDLVRAWELHGHEIAMHHHPESAPATWDGFSNTHEGPNLLGSMDDLMAYVSAIPVSGVIRSGTTEEFPLSNNTIRYTAARGPTPYVSASNRGDLASVPCAWTEDGAGVWRLRMRAFTNKSAHNSVLETELPQAVADLEGHPEGPFVLGFVTHAKNVGEEGIENYEALFAALSEASVELRGLEDVAGLYPWTLGDPSDPAAPHACPRDEALAAPAH